MKALLLLAILMISLDSFASEECQSSIQLRDKEGNITSLCVQGQKQKQAQAQDMLLAKLEAGREEMERMNNPEND